MQSKEEIQKNLEARLENVAFKGKEDFEQEFDMNEKQVTWTKGKIIVYRLTSKKNKKIYGIKYVELDKSSDLSAEQQLSIKKNFLVRHTNVVKYYDIYRWEAGDKITYVVKQDCCEGNLELYIQKLKGNKKKFTDVQLLWILKQNADIIDHLSKEHLRSNQSLCVENIQTAVDDVWKITGFDHAFDHLLDQVEPEKNIYYSPEYMQAVKNGTLDQIDLVKCDIYSLGVILIKCAALYEDSEIVDLNIDTTQETQERITKMIRGPKISAGGAKKFQANLIDQMIQLLPEKRMSLDELKSRINCATIRQELQK